MFTHDTSSVLSLTVEVPAGTIELTYRPFETFKQRLDFESLMREPGDPFASMDGWVCELGKRVETWTVQDPDGKPIEPTPEAFRSFCVTYSTVSSALLEALTGGGDADRGEGSSAGSSSVSATGASAAEKSTTPKLASAGAAASSPR